MIKNIHCLWLNNINVMPLRANYVAVLQASLRYRMGVKMRKYIYICLGGIAGAVQRYLIRSLPILSYAGNIPWNTLVINLTGCFLLAFVLSAARDVLRINADLKLGIATGLAGAYTTFFTLCKETVNLIAKGHYILAGLYIVLSVLLGIACVYCGITWAEKAAVNIKKTKKEDTEINSVSKRR